MMIINIDSGEVRNVLDEIRRVSTQSRRVLRASAEEVENTLRRHFLDRNKRGNRLGGRRTNFWNRVRNATGLGAVTDAQADVVIGSVAFAQKLHGGPIVAKAAEFLTIPVHAQAHGRTVYTFKKSTGIKLFFIDNNWGGGALAARNQDKSITVYYALRKEVNQAPDPEALPRGQALEEAAQAGAMKSLRRIINEASA